jgi:hypothetical protein
MAAIRGRYIDGKVVLDTPPDWPEGAEVSVHPVEEYVGIGMREEDWPTTPEGIAALIAEMDRIEPFLSPEEDEAWRKALAEQKARQKATWDKWTKEAGELFQ